jgi:ketosteroid isomerase-like protein
MPDSHTEKVLRFLECVEAKDLDGTMAFFTEDAEFFDPHYPKARMKGLSEIAEGTRWGFSSLKKLGFDIITTYPSIDGNGLVVSMRTAHELPNGKLLTFPQLFLFEFEGERIKLLHAYVQYEPHGMVGVILKLSRVKRVLARWITSYSRRT